MAYTNFLFQLFQQSSHCPYSGSVGADLLRGNQIILPGDMMDVELLSVAVPVSHYVLTDRRMAERMKRLGIIGLIAYDSQRRDRTMRRLTTIL